MSSGNLGAVLGGVGGFMIGGPQGAMIGAGLGGSLGGSMDAAEASKDAARAQQRAAEAAIAEQRAAREQITQQLAPFVGAGGAAQAQLLELLGIRDPAQTAAYQQALAFKPQFGEKERAMILQAGPTGRGRGGGAVVTKGEGQQPMMAGGGQVLTQQSPRGGGAFFDKFGQIPQVQQARTEAQSLERYQQALAEQQQIEQNRNLIQQYEGFQPSERFGMLTRDVTQGLPSVMPGDIEQDSLFQSLKRQAISGIEGSAAARGKLMSGTTPQAIAEQVQNLGLQRAGQIQAMNLAARGQVVGERTAEQERRYQQLFGLLGTGQASAAQQAANISGTASNVGELLTQSANARAAGLVGAANAQSQMYQGLLGAGTTLGAASIYSGRGLGTGTTPVTTPPVSPAPLPGLGAPGYSPNVPAAPLPGLGGPGYMNVGGTGIAAPWRY